MKKILEKVREQLHTMLNSGKFTNEEILAVSQQLDKLIVIYYELNSLNPSENKT
jgi:hypothetical protein